MKIIKLQIDTSLVIQVKKAAKVRGISMSDYIWYRLESGFRTNSKVQEPEIFKWFSKLKYDEDIAAIDEVFKNIKESRKDLNIRNSQEY